MNKTSPLSLIDGSFCVTDAEEVLSNLFTSKIRFHEMKNFSSQERFGTNDAIAEKRIPELKRSLEEALHLMTKARKENHQVRLRSTISIELVEVLEEVSK